MILWLIGLWVSLSTQYLPNHIPEIKTDYSVFIKGFPEDSLANQISTIRYKWGWLTMVTTMIWENGWFDKDIKSITNDHWLCQLNYRWHKDFINSTWFKDPFNQAYYCLEVWNDAIKKKRLPTTFYAYNWRKRFENRVSVKETKYYELFNYKIEIETCLILKNWKQQSCQK